MFTYIATNTINGKFYIGSTTDFEVRKQNHLHSKCKYPFQNSLRQHPDDFIWEVWEDDVDEPILEQALLDMWFGKEQCYNLNGKANIPPNLTGHKFSKETLEKRSNTRRGKNYCGTGPDHHRYGIPHTEEAKLANKEKHLGSFWVNNGSSEKTLSEGSLIPDGYIKGRLFNLGGYPWWVKESGETTRSPECPGPGWREGRKWPVDRPVPDLGYWWVNHLGETCRSKDSPGEGWKRGRKW